MGTRSSIAIEKQDGTVESIYCHWDGYLEHNGKILQEDYSDLVKLQQLIDLGDMSVLGKEIGEKQNFDNGSNSIDCLFYGRDRGETGIDKKIFKDFDEYLKEQDWQDFNYILRKNNTWYVDGKNLEFELNECDKEHGG